MTRLLIGQSYYPMWHGSIADLAGRNWAVMKPCVVSPQSSLGEKILGSISMSEGKGWSISREEFIFQKPMIEVNTGRA